jgi:carbohydrate kinase (thermoresistant glucokinase family)
MGVSGCGKTTVASELARQLGMDMTDGDDLHLPASVDKMRAGIPLEDADRWPWLDRIGQHLAQITVQGRGRVVACSALKRSYRDRIRKLAPDVRFVFLQGSASLIRDRLSSRQGHYMPPDLLDSQFKALEVPTQDETDVIAVSIDQTLDALVMRAMAGLQTGAPSLS